MTMTVAKFRAELIAQAQTRAAAGEDFTHSAFTELCGELLEAAEELADFQPCYYRGKGTRRRNLAVDGYNIDDVDGSIRLVVTDFSGDLTAPALTKTEAQSLFGALTAFIEDSVLNRLERDLEESSPAYGLATELRSLSAVPRFRLYLVSDRELSDRVKDWADTAINGIPVDFNIWDASRFFRAHESASGRDELELDFTGLPGGGIPCLSAHTDKGGYEGYLCVIPGPALAALYEKYGSRLLEGNVRSFLSTTGKVNKGIQLTIKQEPHMFFAYNNGIAATANRVEMARTALGQVITAATDLQIVNGGQTTASLALALRKRDTDISDVLVQMKMSVIPGERAGTVIPLISRFSNSQNKVSEADFFANHEFHRKIEGLSRSLRAPATGGSQVETRWYYERARGQYLVDLNRLSVAEKKRFQLENPRAQLFTKTDLAKSENSWAMLPYEVSKGAQKNFLRFATATSEAWIKEPMDFNEEYFRNAVARLIIFRTLEKLIPSQPWYDGGFRAQLVTYTMARLRFLLDQEYPGRTLDLQKIWRTQALTPTLQEQLLLIAEQAHKVVTKPEAGMQNPAEWCKKDIAWTRLASRDVRVLPLMVEELDDTRAVLSRKVKAKDDARTAHEVDAMSTVMSHGTGGWLRLSRWVAANRFNLKLRESRLLQSACRPGWLPQGDEDSTILARLLESAKQDGFG
jgi:hypothetical protein